MNAARPAIGVLMLGLLAGCESTTFQAPPLAAGPCDSTLAGVWWSKGDDVDPDGEVELRIDAACLLDVIEHENGVVKHGPTVTLHTAISGPARYLWVDAAWVGQRFDPDFQPPTGDVVVARYRVEGDTLQLDFSDDKAIAHRIVDGELGGEVHAANRELHARLVPPYPAGLLEQAGMFKAADTYFIRHGDSP